MKSKLERILETVLHFLLCVTLPLIALSGVVLLIVLLNVHAYNDYALRLEAFDRDTTIVKLLLHFGADVHAKNDQALQIAAHKGDTEIAEILLDHKANVHAEDDAALYQASLNGHEDIVRLLLMHGADVHAKDDSALQAAIINNHPEIVELLLDHGVNVSGCRGRTLIDFADRKGFKSIETLIRKRRSSNDESHGLACSADKLLETNP